MVKELLENALDAGATRIEVTVAGAGIDLIRVVDDGHGIPPQQLPLAFERHATSKLRAARELPGVRSYGFRGEALPSVAAVAEIDCLSRTPERALGARLRIQHGRPAPLEPAGAPLGTTVEARDLFARQPARRKFLAGARGERAAIARVCAEAALARPDVALHLRAEGRAVLSTGGEGERRAVLRALWGLEPAETALSFSGARPEAGLRLTGLAAPPQHHRGRRDALRLFVNARPVTSRRLNYAVEEAYRELLPAGRHPLAVCFLEAEPGRVDVNVHPTKAQVKLADEDAAFSLIQRTLRAALLQAAGPRPLDPSPFTAAAAPAAAAFPLPAPSDPPGPEAAALRRATTAATPVAGAGAATALAPSPSPPPTPAPPAIPPLRALGQVGATFLVAEGPDALYLIDQHGAHERVLYERLLAAPAGPEARQPVLDPPLLELSAEQAAALAGHEAALTALGFELEPFGERTLRLRALPACWAPGDARSALLALLDDLAGPDRVPERHDPVAASAACHAAVRAGQRLEPLELRALLRDLERCLNPHTCPHGRPTLLRLSNQDLARRFLRR